MLRSGFETTNRNEGRRLFGLAALTADSPPASPNQKIPNGFQAQRDS
jgi:hypothetical protein